MQKGIEAEQRYLLDVQAYVAYTDDPMTREERAAQSEAMQDQEFDCRQLSFLSFVLDHYAKERVTELDDTKQGPLLKLKYNNVLAGASAELGTPDAVRRAFVGLQKYLSGSVREMKSIATKAQPAPDHLTGDRKEKGLVVDHIGIKSRMNMAQAMYSKNDEVNFEEIRQSLTEVRNHLDLLRTLFHTLITSLASLLGGKLQELPRKLSS
ncbi:type I restriction-modification enzyme R subunit C-terminal domain-containing protein [Aeromonas caviae]